MPCDLDDALELVHQLEQVRQDDSPPTWSTFTVAGRSFGYLWPATGTVGLKQLLGEQLALVAERPSVFEPQFSAGRFGWVVVHLDGLERDELAELVFEAWRLSAPEELVLARADRLPS